MTEFRISINEDNEKSFYFPDDSKDTVASLLKYLNTYQIEDIYDTDWCDSCGEEIDICIYKGIQNINFTIW